MNLSKAFKCAFSVILSVFLIFGSIPFSGLADIGLPNNINPFTAKAANATSGTCGNDLKWKYSILTGTLTISGNGDMTDYYEDSPWDAYKDTIEKVVIGKNVTSIGAYAFYDCSLTSITIPNSVTSIGLCAFYNCTSLESITIPAGVMSMEDGLSCCFSLERITVDSNNKNYSSDDYGVLFNKDKTELIQYPCGNSRTSYTIPAGVMSIDGSAFHGCTSLETITIPASVTNIETWAFYDYLTSITVDGNNNNYSSDKYGVLFNKDKTELIQYPCGNSRTSYIIPAGVTSINDYAFENCTSLERITIPDSVTNIGYSAFGYCSSLKIITLPNTVTNIDGSAFNCTAYYNNNSNWENGVLYMGKHLIEAKNTISGSYKIKDGTIAIASCAFCGCTSLTSITIPDSVTSIGNYAFDSCKSLASITISDSVTSIGYSAFKNTAYYNNSSNWENGVLYIGKHLIVAKNKFSGTYKIKDGTIAIAESAFDWCESLKSIIIPDSVTSITDGVFFGCTSLTSVTIPNSITRIGDFAFNGCEKLTDIYYSGSRADWAKISIGKDNDCLTKAVIHYNYVSDVEVSESTAVQKETAVSVNGETAVDGDANEFVFENTEKSTNDQEKSISRFLFVIPFGIFLAAAITAFIIFYKKKR